ncbi:MAG: TRAP transporter substrate-binding protein [Alphaproteobacteria bacterium]|nr:TRAP transporter substrate-binding protein [Alphaproteobacteria bacterium]
MINHRNGLFAALAAALALSVGSARGANWDMPTPYPDGNFHTKNIVQFAADVDKATNGAIKIKVHANGSLFKHPEIKNAVRSGQAPIGEILLSNLGNENPVFAVDSLPFLASNYDESKKLWAASKAATDKLLRQQGLMVLFAVAWPPQGIYAKKELKSVDDMRGIKFRTYNPATTDLARLAGAVPTQIEVPDIPTAFTTGRVDAMITSPSTGVNSKAWDYVSDYHDTQAWLPKNVVMVNVKSFQALDKKIQDAIMTAAKAAEDRGWKASVEETDSMTKELAGKGMKVHKPSPQLMTGLKKIGDQMTAEWAKKAGAEGEAILKAYRGK